MNLNEFDLAEWIQVNKLPYRAPPPSISNFIKRSIIGQQSNIEL